jgi:hypothetical protein
MNQAIEIINKHLKINQEARNVQFNSENGKVHSDLLLEFRILEQLRQEFETLKWKDNYHDVDKYYKDEDDILDESFLNNR